MATDNLSNNDLINKTVLSNSRSSDPPRHHVSVPSTASNLYYTPTTSIQTRQIGRPFYYILSMSRLVINCFYSPFRILYRIIATLYNYTRHLILSIANCRPYQPELDVGEFITEINTKYTANHYPFHNGSYRQVLNQAKMNIQFLIVYLHSPNHSDTVRFCRAILTSDEFSNLLAEFNVILWGVSVKTLEGSSVSRIVREHTYPCIAIIMLRQNRMEIVNRIEGYRDPAEYIRSLRNYLTLQESELVVARTEKSEREFTRQLRVEQDLEYQESLMLDEAKIKLEEETKKREIEEERIRQEEVQQYEELKRNRIESAKKRLTTSKSESLSEDVIQIKFKLPTLTLTSSFSTLQTVQHLYDFIVLSDGAPENFQIALNFPKRVLDIETKALCSLSDVGINQPCTLFVENLDS